MSSFGGLLGAILLSITSWQSSLIGLNGIPWRDDATRNLFEDLFVLIETNRHTKTFPGTNWPIMNPDMFGTLAAFVLIPPKAKMRSCWKVTRYLEAAAWTRRKLMMGSQRPDHRLAIPALKGMKNIKVSTSRLEECQFLAQVHRLTARQRLIYIQDDFHKKKILEFNRFLIKADRVTSYPMCLRNSKLSHKIRDSLFASDQTLWPLH